jgi:hypothetical protein
MLVVPVGGGSLEQLPHHRLDIIETCRCLTLFHLVSSQRVGGLNERRMLYTHGSDFIAQQQHEW